MKIYIATFYSGLNFGSRLQANALSRYLEKKGHDVYMLGKFRDFIFMFRHPAMFKTRWHNLMNLAQKRSFFFRDDYRISDKRKKRLKEYEVDNFIVVNVTGEMQWKRICKDDPVFVSGSDIIWNPALGQPAKFFLDFAYYAKKKCFSYATSIGAKELPSEYEAAYRRYLDHYVCLSTREAAAAKMIQKYTRTEVARVVDPTLLLSREEWDEFAKKADLGGFDSTRRYILCYFVMHDEEYWNCVNKLHKTTGARVVVLPTCQKDEERGFEYIFDATPYEFIELIKNAEYVCTDSLHASLFSMIYEKEFYLIPRQRKAEEDKFNEILERYGLEDRLITDVKNFVPGDTIDYDKVSRKLTDDITFSKLYLDEALERCGG